MFNKIVRIATILVVIILLITLNTKMLPQRMEITDIAIGKVIGLDVENEESVLTAVAVNTEQTKSGSKEEGGGSSGNNSALVSRAETFKMAEKLIQSYTDKSIDVGHVSCFFIGEETARNKFTDAISYGITNEEVRLNTKVYVIKGESAENFIKAVIKDKYDINEKLKNIENNNKQVGTTFKMQLYEAMKIMKSEENTGIVPLLELNKEEIKNQGEENSSQEELSSQNINFNLAGYAIIKENKLVDFLSIEESIGYNFIKNLIQSSAITVNDLSGKKVEIGLTKANTNTKFEFDKDKLKKIKIDVKVCGNLEDMNLTDEFSKLEERIHFEKEISKKIESQIQAVINKAKEIDSDFIKVKEDILRKKHPYKYDKIKDNVKNIWKEAEIEINVQSEIERNYNIIKSIKQG